ncbi:MAG: zinc ribbon domain-containing protein [Pyrinomonadaceae bacterium]
MYCPRCSQQQVSEETKFCSRCGFPLGLVSEILAHGGFLPQLAELYKSKNWLTKRNGIVFSVFWFMFFVLIMCPFFGILDIDKLAGASAVVGIFGGLMWLIASLVLLKNEPNQPFAPMYELPPSEMKSFRETSDKHLPPQQTSPAQSYVPPAASWKAADTGDLLHPRSVTEGTTKLLKKDE